MEKRMDKEELIKLLKSLKLNKDEYWILSSGDLDIAVTEKGLQELKNNYNLKKKDNGWYTVTDKIECFPDTKDSWKIEKYGEYNLESIEKYYKFLKKSSREKDKARIPLIEEYMKNK